MNETFFATTDWCLCVSISFIILLSHNSDDVTGLFPVNTVPYRQHWRLEKYTTDCIFLSINLLKISCRKRWKCISKTLNFKKSGVARSQIPLQWAAFGTTTFLPRVRTATKSHATPLRKIYIKFSIRAYRGWC